MDNTTQSSTISVPIFNGENYDFWRVKIETYFSSQDLWDIVEEGFTIPADTSALNASQEKELKKNKLNWALEEKVKHLCMENQVWRNIAETNEATANALRCNLEQVLAQRGGMAAAAEEDVGGGATVCGGAEMDDAESCCGSTEEDGLEKETGGWRTLAGCAGVKDKEGGGNGNCSYVWR